MIANTDFKHKKVDFLSQGNTPTTRIARWFSAFNSRGDEFPTDTQYKQILSISKILDLTYNVNSFSLNLSLLYAELIF